MDLGRRRIESEPRSGPSTCPCPAAGRVSFPEARSRQNRIEQCRLSTAPGCRGARLRCRRHLHVRKTQYQTLATEGPEPAWFLTKTLSYSVLRSVVAGLLKVDQDQDQTAPAFER